MATIEHICFATFAINTVKWGWKLFPSQKPSYLSYTPKKMSIILSPRLFLIATRTHIWKLKSELWKIRLSNIVCCLWSVGSVSVDACCQTYVHSVYFNRILSDWIAFPKARARSLITMVGWGLLWMALWQSVCTLCDTRCLRHRFCSFVPL